MLAIFMLFLGGCGDDRGGAPGSSNSSNAAPGSARAAANSVAVIVDSGPAAAGGSINRPFVSVTICVPANPSDCQTIDHVLVDMGSTGLRILASVLGPSLSASLPQETDSKNNAFVECVQFADGYSWGPIKMVTLQVGGESAPMLPVQVIGDPPYKSLVPANCSGIGVPVDTVATLGANGVLGVAPFVEDCGNVCVTAANVGVYYSCNPSCQMTTAGLAQQVQNPVTLFAIDNNGVVLTFPPVPTDGIVKLSGTLTFGVDTQSNNGLGGARVYTVDPNTGYMTTVFNGVSYPDSLLDSGSNGVFFNDTAIPQCGDGSGDYCPSSPLNLSAVNVGQNGTSGGVSFSIGNAETMTRNNPDSTAFGGLAGTNADPGGFDWGLPFFFGRSVYTVIEGKSTSEGTGPYIAY